MTARNTDTKQEIIRIGKELIRLYGYNAFSYADISGRLNMKNAAVHYHFRGKEDLLAGILQNYIDEYIFMGKQLRASGLPSGQKLGKFIERYSQLVESNSICIIGSVAADYNTLPESVKDIMGNEKKSKVIAAKFDALKEVLLSFGGAPLGRSGQ